MKPPGIPEHKRALITAMRLAAVPVSIIVAAANAMPGERVTFGQVEAFVVARPALDAPVPVAPLTEPAPGPDGIVAAPFLVIRDWCQRHGLETDGTNMDRVNKARRHYGRPPMVVDCTAS